MPFFHPYPMSVFRQADGKEQKMVDSVSFGPAKPVPGLGAHNVKRESRGADQASPRTAPHNLSLAAALAQLGPPHDAGKVASLKAAIASGSYQINLGDIADGIIRFGGGDLG
jgi:flagellar biosynthesis anti-sigma factor FlgM